jgi:hypothetical protein
LLKFSTCEMAEPSTGTPQVVRSQILHVSLFGRGLHHVPNGLRRDSIAPDLYPVDSLDEKSPPVDASRRDPHIDGAFRPEWNRNGPNVFSFANQVSNHAALLADLGAGSPGSRRKKQDNCEGKRNRAPPHYFLALHNQCLELQS